MGTLGAIQLCNRRKTFTNSLINYEKGLRCFSGSAHKDLLGRLMAFRQGLACSPMQYDDGNPPYRHFAFWFPLRFWGEANNLPWTTLEGTLGSEGGYHKFWELLDEYRKCSIEDVAALEVKPHHKQRTVDGGGSPLGNPIPARRFISSPVHSLNDLPNRAELRRSTARL